MGESVCGKVEVDPGARFACGHGSKGIHLQPAPLTVKGFIPREVNMHTKLMAIIVLAVTQFFISSPVFSKENDFTTLRVALYPYVPNRHSLFHKVEKIFESRNPGVNLELVEDSALLEKYYSGGLQKTVADVYEVDTILLSDLIKSGKILPIKLPSGSFTKEAIAAVTRNGDVYGVPHWLCGNFLIYKKGDKEIESSKTWKDLNEVLKKRNESVFVDFKGKSTLGEWYLTALSGQQGLEQAQKHVLESEELDEQAVSSLASMLKSCPAGFCRNDDLHDRAGYYSRAFIAGKSSGYVGYSESIHYGIQYAIDNCTKTSSCLSIDDIAVRRLPGFSERSVNEGIGWVDALATDSSLDAKKKNLAAKFIEFMVSEEAYKVILEPEWGEAPRYLIPAQTGINIKNAPLYGSFYEAHSGRATGTLVGLNNKLRAMGKKLNCELPISRTDIVTLEQCTP